MPEYATPEQALAWKSPAPLSEDYTHSETGQVYRIDGIARAADRKGIYLEIARIKEAAAGLAPTLGYVPDDADIIDACWAAACVTNPKLTNLQWLQFGSEATLGELSQRCFVASRVVEDRKSGALAATVPDGETAAEAELKEDPTLSGGLSTA